MFAAHGKCSCFQYCDLQSLLGYIEQIIVQHYSHELGLLVISYVTIKSVRKLTMIYIDTLSTVLLEEL